MFKVKKNLFLLVCGAVILLTGCSVGTADLFVHPSEQGYPYEVTYDVMGGNINQFPYRTVYYEEESLLFKPQGTAGMLVEPKNGEKTFLGWYTAYTEESVGDTTVYHFSEENHWDFDSDRVDASNAPDEKLTLYARWADNPAIMFIDEADSEEEVLLKWMISVGSVLSKPTSSEPSKSGHVLLDYYADKDCTVKYEFGTIVDESIIQYDDAGNAVVRIYCKFMEGDYVRVKTVAQLQDIANQPDAHYILANDIDLNGQTWNPIKEFNGVLDGNGYAIRNLTVNAKNRASGIAAKNADEVSFGLFATLDGAEISNLTMKDTKVVIDASSNVKLCAGALAGRTKSTVIKDCVFDGTVIESTGDLKVDLVISPTAAGDSSTKYIDCTVTDYVKTGIQTSGTFEELGVQ